MYRSRLLRLGAGAAALALTLALAVASRDGSTAAQGVNAAPTYHLHEEGAEHLMAPPDAVAAATEAFTSSISTLPPTSIDTARRAGAVQTGAYHGTLVPPGFTGTPANSAATYSGPTLTVLSTYIGREAAEPTIGVTKDGNAFYAAGTFDSPGGVAARTEIWRSLNNTNTGWAQTPGNFGLPDDFNESLDPYVWVDADNGALPDRVYSGDLAVVGIRFVHSDDDGQTWTAGSPVGADVPVDHQTFITAKPVVGSPFQPVGYPNLMYFCSNRVVEVGCSRSVNGGLAFTTTGAPAYPGVDTVGGVGVCGGLHGHLVSDSVGRLFLPKGHCGFPWVAISADSGTTWNRVQIENHISLPHHEVTLAVDSDDNIYAVWQDTARNLPYLSVSTTNGTSWSTPRMIAPPGVLETNFPTITAGHAGRIAITFPGTTQTGSTRPWNQYLIVSTDALTTGTPGPLFVWTTHDDPVTNPVRRGACGPGRCGGMFDFLDIITSPKDGAFWATASDTCAGSAACVGGQKTVGDGVAIKQTGGPSLWEPPTAVTLASFRGKATRLGVDLRWRTASETRILGFNVWRFADGKSVKVNRSLVDAQDRAAGAIYRILDRSPRTGVFMYRLQAVGWDGKRTWHARTTVRLKR